MTDMTAAVDKLADEIAHRIEVGTGASYHHSLRALARAAAKTALEEAAEHIDDGALEGGWWYENWLRTRAATYTTEEPS